MTVRVAMALIAGVVLAAPSARAAAWTKTPNVSIPIPPPPITRIVEIDGRFIAITISVTTLIPGIPIEGTDGKNTTASVRLSIQDGARLPGGLRASRIRFEKLRGGSRVFHTYLREVGTESSGYELDVRGYESDISSKVGTATRLRATVRLDYKGRVYRVPMGFVPVVTEGPFP